MSQLPCVRSQGTAQWGPLLRVTGCHKAAIKVSARAVVSLRLDWGGIYSQAHVAASSVPLLAECQAEGLSFLLAVSQRLTTAPCLMAFTWQLTLLQGREEGVSQQARCYNPTQHNHTYTQTHTQSRASSPQSVGQKKLTDPIRPQEKLLVQWCEYQRATLAFPLHPNIKKRFLYYLSRMFSFCKSRVSQNSPSSPLICIQ